MLVIATALVVGACGFQLRGTDMLPPELNPLLIEGGGATALGRALIARIPGSQIRLTEDPAEAQVRIRVLDEGRGSRVVAVDRQGKVLAYELRFRATFEALGADGQVLVPPQSIDLVRTFDDPDIEVLGKQEEAEMIFADLHDDAADRVLLRLRAALR